MCKVLPPRENPKIETILKLLIKNRNRISETICKVDKPPELKYPNISIFYGKKYQNIKNTKQLNMIKI